MKTLKKLFKFNFLNFLDFARNLEGNENMKNRSVDLKETGAWTCEKTLGRGKNEKYQAA